MLMTTTITLINLFLLLVIPILIGVYVYKDARSRNMNAPLWTLIAILVPALIGFIIYLLVRGSYSNMKCPNCKANVTKDYVSCPNCGTKLKATCPNCSTPVEKDWNVCPKCSTPLPTDASNIATPIAPKDHTLKKILLAVVLIPALLLILSIVCFSFITTSSTDSSVQSVTTDDDNGASISSTSTNEASVTSLPVAEYLEVTEYLEVVNNPQIEEWLETIGDTYNKAYVLQHDTSLSNHRTRTRYLIYSPCFSEQPQVSMNVSSGFFHQTVRLNLKEENKNVGNTVLLVTNTTDKTSKLKLYFNEKKMDCEIKKVDYPLGLTDTNS